MKITQHYAIDKPGGGELLAAFGVSKIAILSPQKYAAGSYGYRVDWFMVDEAVRERIIRLLAARGGFPAADVRQKYALGHAEITIPQRVVKVVAEEIEMPRRGLRPTPADLAGLGMDVDEALRRIVQMRNGDSFWAKLRRRAAAWLAWLVGESPVGADS